MRDLILCKGSQTLRYEKTKDRKRPYPMCWDHAEDRAAASCWPRRCWWSDNTHLQHTEISPCIFYLPQPVRTETHTDRHIHSHTYTCTCIHTKARRETHSYIYTQTRAHPQAQEITHAHTHAGTRALARARTHTHTHRHTHTGTHTHSYTHTGIHTHTHTHTHTHMRTYSQAYMHTHTHAQTYTHIIIMWKGCSPIFAVFWSRPRTVWAMKTALCMGMHTVYIQSILWFKVYACKLALGKSSHCWRLKKQVTDETITHHTSCSKKRQEKPENNSLHLILLLDCGSKTQTSALNDTKELRLVCQDREVLISKQRGPV